MGQRFPLDGRQVHALRSSERDAIARAVMQLHAWSVATDAQYQVQSACQDLFRQLWTLANNTVSSRYLIAMGSGIERDAIGEANHDIHDLPCEIPVIGGGTWDETPGAELPVPTGIYADWATDPELNAIYRYGTGGMIIDVADARAIQSLIDGVVSIEQGRCAWRVKWGLVGITALLGAAVVGTGAYIYSRRYKRRAR